MNKLKKILWKIMQVIYRNMTSAENCLLSMVHVSKVVEKQNSENLGAF